MAADAADIRFDQALTAYETVAADYDSLAIDPLFSRWVSFYQRLIEKYGSGGKKLLDVGCGTGNSAVAFRNLGYEVTGSDLSPAMIDRARAKPDNEGIPFVVGDLRDLPDLGSFDAVTCMGEPLSYLTDDQQLSGAFRSVARQLADGGVFVFDMNTLGSYQRAYAVTRIIDEDGHFDVWEGGPVPVEPDAVIDVTHTYFRRVGEGGRAEGVEANTWRRVTSRHVYRHHSDATVRRLLADSGLRLVAAHGLTAGELTDSGDEIRGRKILYVVSR
ncbi:class I SAM-dependent methyltransferase [Streptomyces sp. BHT-5-2]|uniref:class I SAM-dependent DNA methyltransferase n=1 Tax=unclassified Streptomyces TaxID=2593676 RepID=UPI001C8E4CA9|nr:class I SAM-dependent methyltransferase [Streptomyces sp. BHT-5-2]QZL04274.1 class I SAM-dependent methyltransferase [Streptomyces sp. BHT-5-2]